MTIQSGGSLYLSQADLPRAQPHVEEILSYLEGRALGGSYYLEEPLHVYLTCCRVLRANDDARADSILEETHALLQERAAMISDEGERRSFLENLPSHRQIVAAWEKRCLHP